MSGTRRAKGRYRPYLGWKLGDAEFADNIGSTSGPTARKPRHDGPPSGVVGRDEADEKGGESRLWCGRRCTVRRRPDRQRRVSDFIPFDPEVVEGGDSVAEYAQVIHVYSANMFPSLDLVPAEPHLYALGLSAN